MLHQKLLIALFLLAGVPAARAQVCSDPINIIYGLTKNGDIVPVDVNTAALGARLNSSADPGYPGATRVSNAIGLDIQTKTFYYFHNNISSSQKFNAFNGATNTYQSLASSPIRGSVVKGCISADGTGYYCIDSASTLCYYSILTNTWSKISSTIKNQYNTDLGPTFSALGNGDMVIDGLGNLWIVAASTTKWGLYELNAPLPTTTQASITLNEMVAPTQPTPSGLPFVGIAYNPTGQIYMCTVNDLYLLQSNLSITHINSFSTTGIVVDLTSCNFPFLVLPLSLESFSASLQGNQGALLQWTANQQISTAGYSIERSADGRQWTTLAYQPSNTAPGTGQYRFTDDHPADGVNYYRLLVDLADGNASYSPVRSVYVAVASGVKVWPTAASDYLNVQVPVTGGTLRFFNSSGQEMDSRLLAGGVNRLDIGALPRGYYVVEIILPGGAIVSTRMMKQ